MKRVLFFLCVPFFGCFSYDASVLTASEYTEIARKIFHNECGSKEENLVFWNAAEAFPSLGIGHFIWHPAHKKELFEEAFPAFIKFAHKHGASVPHWLIQDGVVVPCPWATIKEFEAIHAVARKKELKDFLLKTMTLQAEFIIDRFYGALQTILALKPELVEKMKPLTRSAQGLYALIDYVNFKGSGTVVTESYNGKGWGLIQVLEAMALHKNTKEALHDFVLQAKQLLHMRVSHAKAVHEKRFIPGWYKRLETYLI